MSVSCELTHEPGGRRRAEQKVPPVTERDMSHAPASGAARRDSLSLPSAPHTQSDTHGPRRASCHTPPSDRLPASSLRFAGRRPAWFKTEGVTDVRTGRARATPTPWSASAPLPSLSPWPAGSEQSMATLVGMPRAMVGTRGEDRCSKEVKQGGPEVRGSSSNTFDVTRSDRSLALALGREHVRPLKLESKT